MCKCIQQEQRTVKLESCYVSYISLCNSSNISTLYLFTVRSYILPNLESVAEEIENMSG